jgi:hypothetical protein
MRAPAWCSEVGAGEQALSVVSGAPCRQRPPGGVDSWRDAGTCQEINASPGFHERTFVFIQQQQWRELLIHPSFFRIS